MSATSPVMKDAQGSLLGSASVGQLVVLSTTVSNAGEARPFVAVMEARDEEGVTQFLGFSIGNLDNNGTSEIGISWSPNDAGSYQLRTLVSGFQDPQILTVTETSDATVE